MESFKEYALNAFKEERAERKAKLEKERKEAFENLRSIIKMSFQRLFKRDLPDENISVNYGINTWDEKTPSYVIEIDEVILVVNENSRCDANFFSFAIKCEVCGGMHSFEKISNLYDLGEALLHYEEKKPFTCSSCLGKKHKEERKLKEMENRDLTLTKREEIMANFLTSLRAISNLLTELGVD